MGFEMNKRERCIKNHNSQPTLTIEIDKCGGEPKWVNDGFLGHNENLSKLISFTVFVIHICNSLMINDERVVSLIIEWKM